MYVFRPFAILLTILLTVFCFPVNATESCPVTNKPNVDFWGAFPVHHESFWYGTAALAVPLEKSGVWSGKFEQDYRRKIFWYREGYDWKQEPSPELAVTARSFDEPTITVSFGRASASFREDMGMSFISMLAEFPRDGCWEISAKYRDTVLTFVVQVESYTSSNGT
jgi:hypothetical protein